MEFYGFPPIGRKQRRPARPRGLPGAQMGHSFIPRGLVKPVGDQSISRNGVEDLFTGDDEGSVGLQPHEIQAHELVGLQARG
jgi:hypothetical protein